MSKNEHLIPKNFKEAKIDSPYQLVGYQQTNGFHLGKETKYPISHCIVVLSSCINHSSPNTIQGILLETGTMVFYVQAVENKTMFYAFRWGQLLLKNKNKNTRTRRSERLRPSRSTSSCSYGVVGGQSCPGQKAPAAGAGYWGGDHSPPDLPAAVPALWRCVC